MKLVVVRHGITESNVKQLLNGQGHDDNLTTEGKNQAKELAERLKDMGIEQIYSSPLKRTTETALPIAEKLDKPINIDIRLIEVSFGSLEGGPNDSVMKVMGKSQRQMFDEYEYDFSEFGGETSKQVEARVRAFLKDLKKQRYKTVLVVTHGGILRWIRYIVTGIKHSSHPNAVEIELEF